MSADIALVIFDCDGVLVDSERLACAVEAEGLTRAGFPITAEGVLQRFLGMSARDARAVVERELGRSLPADYGQRKADELAAAFRRELGAVPGIAEVVAMVSASGAALCVASSSAPTRIALSLTLVGLHDRFAPHLFSSSMVVNGKPAPDLFLLAADRMGIPPARCLVIEDSPPGIAAGVRAGMRVVGFTGGGHCGPGHADLLRAAGAETICPDAAALGGHVAACLGERENSA